MKTKKIENIIDCLEWMKEDNLLIIHNRYCDECGLVYQQVYLNNTAEFQEVFGSDPLEAVRAAQYSTGDFKYNYTHKYFRISGDGNLESSLNLYDFVDREEIAQHCVECNDYLDNSEIQNILES
ncbi:MAG: hypothetical protein LBH55_04410 [Mycoplasmataceae bacterium]|jgi:hypothetical protein|nr:hypothetical protein [Mycoplasmataceae bacterium]